MTATLIYIQDSTVWVQALSNEAKSRLWELTAKHSGIDRELQRVQSVVYAATSHALAQDIDYVTQLLKGLFCFSTLISSNTLLKLMQLHSLLPKPLLSKR